MTNKVIQIGGLVIGISILGHLGGGMGIGLVSFFQSDLLYTEFFVSPWDVWYFLGAFFTSIIGTWGLNTLFKINTGEREEIIPFLMCVPNYFSKKTCEIIQTIIFALLISIADVITYHYLRVS